MISAREGEALIDGLMCDLDGVVYRGDEPIPGAVDALDVLQRRGVQVCYCTNNSRSTVASYVEKLRGLGLDVDPERVVTSAVVTGEVLAADGAGGRALVVGGPGIEEAVVAAGIETVRTPSEADVDLVVVGWDPTFTYETARIAADRVRAGARFVATNDDATFPAAQGLWPGAGSLLAAIEVAAGRRAEVMGKPHRPMMEVVARRLEGCRAVAAVGDRPDTDLAGGKAMGWQRILVLSGVTSPEEAEGLEDPPDLTLGSLAELPSRLAGLPGGFG
jgi:4-nitrophenyl phosphatase